MLWAARHAQGGGGRATGRLSTASPPPPPAGVPRAGRGFEVAESTGVMSTQDRAVEGLALEYRVIFLLFAAGDAAQITYGYSPDHMCMWLQPGHIWLQPGHTWLRPGLPTVAGLFAFFLSALLLIIDEFELVLSAVLALLLGAYLRATWRACKRIYKKFRLPVGQVSRAHY